MRTDFLKNFIIITFLISFPIHFFYSFLMAIGKVNFHSYLYIQHILLLGILIIGICKFNDLINNYIAKIFMSFFLYSFLLISINIIIANPIISYIEAAKQTFWFLIYLLNFTILSYSYFYYKINLSKILFIILSVMLVIVLSNLTIGSTIPFSLDRIYGSQENNLPNYQLVSMFMLTTWGFYYFNSTNKIFKMISIYIIVVLLSLSGGRSEFFGFILSFLFLLFLNNPIKYFVRICVVILLTSILISFYWDNFYLIIEHSRHFQITDYKNSSSWQAREQILSLNINRILDNPILGSYGSHFFISTSGGAYIHNILSSWQQFGIIGFILYSSLVLVPFFHNLYLYFIKKYRYIDIQSSIYFATYSLILVLVSKSVFWPYLGISIGVYMAMLNNYKRKIKNETTTLIRP